MNSEQLDTAATEGNLLFPIFLKLEQLDVLVVGGGPVGLEKLTALLKNSPRTRLTLVALKIIPEIREFVHRFPNVVLEERAFTAKDLVGKDLVILAANNRLLHSEIKEMTRGRRILTNVADTPDLCDFYLGSIIKKGDLKIAVSTNGKSPTLAKRIREYLEEALPDSIQSILDNLHGIREQLRGDFQYKVKVLNEVTSSWKQKAN